MYKSKQLIYTTLFVYFLILPYLSGQQRPSTQQQRPSVAQIQQSSQSQGGITGILEEKDTVTLRYFTLEDLEYTKVFQDSTLDDFEKYATVRSFERGALNLGNLGSSHLPIIYRSRDNILRDPGFHQYDYYKLNLNDFRFYVTGQAFNDLFFSPLAGQENFKVHARFSTNFQNNLNLSVHLDRINQEGFYRDQKTKTTSFGIGFWKNNTEKNHQLFFTFLANNNNEEQNGGVVTPSIFRVRSQENTYITDGDTRHQNFQYALDNYFILKSPKYKAHHQLHVEHGYYHYGDEDPTTSNDTLTYTERYLTDEKGLRYFMGQLRVKNNFDLSFSTKSFGLQLGMIHQWSKFRRDLDNLYINDVLAYGKLDFAIKKIAKLQTVAEIGLGSNSGNLRLDNDLKVEPVKGLRINGKLKILRYDPSIIHDSLSISNTTVYTNDFSKINEFLLGGRLAYDRLHLELEFNSGIIDNPISYDTFAIPVQKVGSTEYIQALLTHKFTWRFIGLENSICYQKFTDNLYRLPDVYSIHNAYLEFRLFEKNLLTRVGGLYYFTRYEEPLEYFPITGSFYPSTEGVPDDRTLNNFPYMEAYANFKIRDFRLFIKVENLNDLFAPFSDGRQHYQIVNYPQFDWKLRMGVRWLIRG